MARAAANHPSPHGSDIAPSGGQLRRVMPCATPPGVCAVWQRASLGFSVQCTKAVLRGASGRCSVQAALSMGGKHAAPAGWSEGAPQRAVWLHSMTPPGKAIPPMGFGLSKRSRQTDCSQ